MEKGKFEFTTSFTEYRQLISETRDVEVFFKDILPVVFYDGDEEDVVLVKYNGKDFEVICQSVRQASLHVDSEAISQSVINYIKLNNRMVPIVLLMNRKTSSVLYDVSNQEMVDYTCFSDLPPKNQWVYIVFWWEEGTYACHTTCVTGSYDNGAALYMMYYTKNLLMGQVTNVGLQLINDLFSQYYDLDGLRDFARYGTIINPRRSESRFGATQLTKLDNFRGQFQKKQRLNQKTQEEMAKINRINAEKDELEFKNRTVPLSWIRDHHRLPILTTARYITNDLNYYKTIIHSMHVSNNIFYYRCYIGVMSVSAKALREFLGLAYDQVIEILPKADLVQ